VVPKRPSTSLGKRGEQIAREHLESDGYRFVACNWHCLAGELDLVMIDEDEIVFVEVKTRRGERSGRAEEAVSSSKAVKLLTAAEWFLADHPAYHHRLWRCDLVAVTIDNANQPVVAHFVNAIVSG